MKIELEAREFSQDEATEILATIYRIYHGPDRQVDEAAQKTLLPLLKHYGFLGLVRVLKIIIDSSEMKERAKSELSALWQEHFGRTPTEDELEKFGPILGCLREAGPRELLPMIQRGKEIQAEASRRTIAGHPEQAQQVIESALDVVIPGWWVFWHEYGLCLLRQGKYEQAIPHYQRAIAYNEDDSYVWSCSDLRLCYEKLGERDRKWYQSGIEYFRPLMERRPRFWIARYCVAWLMWKTEQFQQAIQLYQEAINDQPDHGWHHSCDDLRACYEQTGRQEEGFEYFSQLAGNRPDLWPAWHSLALLAWHYKKDRISAVEYYRRAIDHHPDGGWYWSWQDMGWCLMELGQLDDADAAFQRAKAIDPKNWLTWHALGNLGERRNRLDEAIRCYREALRLNPRSDWSWVGLGNCHYYSSPPRYSLAWMAYQEALRVSPTLEQPKKEIEKIEAAGQPWTEILALLSAKARTDDLLAICLKLQITYEELRGERLKGRIASLLGICRHEGKIAPLIHAIMEERPDLLPPLLDDTSQDTGSTEASVIYHRHLMTRHQELSTRYDQLTGKIRSLDIDISRETEEFRKQPLVDRRNALETERTAVANQLGEIERRLADSGPTPGT